MSIFPNWHDDLRVPTAGDAVRIRHTVTISADSSAAKSFRVRVQPSSATGSLSERGHALGVLLQRVHQDTTSFLDRHLGLNITSEEVESLRIDLKNLLENYRSALEYTAQHIADLCDPKPKLDKIYFPVAASADTSVEFGKKLDRWFPGLRTRAPVVMDHLMSIQEFNGELWLRQLADLTNFNKHRSLSIQEFGKFESVVIKFGEVGIRVGELGLQSLHIEDGGVLRFVNRQGKQADLSAPRILDVDTKSIAGVGHGITLRREQRDLYRIRGYQDSLAQTVWVVAKNVIRTIDTLHSFLPSSES